MAKKKIQPRRVPRAAEPRMYGDGKPASHATTATGTPAAAAPATGAASRTAPVAARPPVTTTQDYSYVLKDLRRLAITAGGIFALLVVLGLIVG